MTSLAWPMGSFLLGGGGPAGGFATSDGGGAFSGRLSDAWACATPDPCSGPVSIDEGKTKFAGGGFAGGGAEELDVAVPEYDFESSGACGLALACQSV